MGIKCSIASAVCRLRDSLIRSTQAAGPKEEEEEEEEEEEIAYHSLRTKVLYNILIQFVSP